MADKPDRVDVHPAWVWDCPECGVENFCRSVVYGLDDEEDLRQCGKLDDDEVGFAFTAPVFVECWDCATEFEVWLDYPGLTHPDAEDFEDTDEDEE